MPVRIVLDTNILVSALISRDGPPARVLESVKHEGAALITSEAQLAELRRVLSYERIRTCIRLEEAEDLLGNLEAIGEVVTDLPTVNASPDPKDNVILATAIAGRADLVVSGDKKHMLNLGAVNGIPIVDAAAAANRLARRGPRRAR